MHEKMPGTTEFRRFLEGAGLTVGSFDLASPLAATIADLEHHSRFVPFVAPATTQARTFIVHDNFVELDSGLVALTSIAVDGVAYTDAAKLLRPQNATNRRLPFTYLELPDYDAFYSGCELTVTGRWGFCDKVPADVFEGVLNGAAARVAPALIATKVATEVAAAGSLKARQTGPVREEYATSEGRTENSRPFSNMLIKQWQSQWEKLLRDSRYRRRTFVK